MSPSLLLLAAPAHAGTDAAVRITDVTMWTVLLLLGFSALAGWLRLWSWIERRVEPALERAALAARPTRLRAWVPSAPPPRLLGEPWLVVGGLHHVDAAPAAFLPGAVAELLAQAACVVAVHAARLPAFEAALGASVERARRRLFVSEDPPTVPGLAALARHGSPVVLLLDRPPEPDVALALAEHGALAVIVLPGTLGLEGLVASRSAS